MSYFFRYCKLVQETAPDLLCLFFPLCLLAWNKDIREEAGNECFLPFFLILGQDCQEGIVACRCQLLLHWLQGVIWIWEATVYVLRAVKTLFGTFVLLLCLELLGADVYHNIQVVNLRCLADLLRWELWADLLINVGLLLHEIKL